MDTRKVATQYRLTQWAERIQVRKQNGQSIKDFCDEVGVSRNAYFYWQRKLREAACLELANEMAPEKPLIPNGWTRLNTTQAESLVAIEINECRVLVSCDTNPELLQQVCRTLKTL